MNAFTIPDKSSILENNPKMRVKRNGNVGKRMNPLTLPGSSPYPPPKTMKKERRNG